MSQITPKLAADYARDGFVFPLDILSEAEAAALRADLESAEDAVRDDRLIRHPKMIAAASAVLGPDLMVWGSGLFIKEANAPS